MMYCNRCKETFDEAEIIECEYIESHGETTIENRCPYCRSSDIEKAVQCECCGEWYKSTIEDFCDNCMAELRINIGEAAIKFANRHDMRYREVISMIHSATKEAV